METTVSTAPPLWRHLRPSRPSVPETGDNPTSYNVNDYGAVGDGTTDDTEAIQATIEACAGAGGGRVLLPAGGVFLSGTISLRDHVELYIERGARLAASPRWGAYAEGPAVSGLSSGVLGPESPQGRALITATDATDVAICGPGVIDGGGRHFVLEELQEIYRMETNRPFTIFILRCRNVTVRDIEIVDAAYWTVRCSVCEDVLLDGLRIHNDPKLPNNDGIDLDWCRRARVLACDIDTGDDGISLKTCEEFAGSPDSSDIVISGCTIRSRSSAIVIGADAVGAIQRVVVSDCVVRRSHRGLAVNLSQGAQRIGDVLFSDCIVETEYDDDSWWGNGEPLYVSAEPWHGDDVGIVDQVRFRNILCRSENGVVVQAVRPGHVRNVVFQQVRVEVGAWTGRDGGRLDLRPTSGEPFREQPTAGFYLENAEDVRLHDCEVAWCGAPRDRWGRALESRSSGQPDIRDLRGTAADPSTPAVVIS